MNVKIVKNGEVILQNNSVDTIQKPATNRKVIAGNGNATIVKNGKVIAKMEEGVVTNGAETPEEVVTETTFNIGGDPDVSEEEVPQTSETEEVEVDQAPEVEEEDIPQTPWGEEGPEENEEIDQTPEVEEEDISQEVPEEVEEVQPAPVIPASQRATIDGNGRRVIGGASIRTGSGFINPEEY